MVRQSVKQNMIYSRIKIFVDFDGTITQQDVGDAIFLKYCDTDKVNNIITDLLSDNISAQQCWEMLCDLVNGIDRNELNNYIDSFSIDPYFCDFAVFCNKNRIPFYVLSDGFDYYINRIFAKEGLEDINYFANRLTVTEDGRFIPSFPYSDTDCRSSANCKRNHIINLSSDDDYTIYIGDGNSDKYVAPFCDYIFAKDDLLRFCERERISYFPFKNFNEVIKRLTELGSKKRLKKSHQAELKRREVYTRE